MGQRPGKSIKDITSPDGAKQRNARPPRTNWDALSEGVREFILATLDFTGENDCFVLRVPNNPWGNSEHKTEQNPTITMVFA